LKLDESVATFVFDYMKIIFSISNDVHYPYSYCKKTEKYFYYILFSYSSLLKLAEITRIRITD